LPSTRIQSKVQGTNTVSHNISYTTLYIGRQGNVPINPRLKLQ